MIIADDNLNVGEPDRSPVAGSEDCELKHEAQQACAALSPVRELVKRFRTDREAIVHEAAKRVHG